MAKAEIEIIYQDAEQLVINKPPGLSITKDRSGRTELLQVLHRQLGLEQGELRIVHRLDKDTSGVLILAKNRTIQSRLSTCFEKGLVKKTYLALVRGLAAERRGVIDAPLAHNRKDPAIMCVDRKKGKHALTTWQVLADFGATNLLAVYPLTGRTHQIRVHLSGIGLPLTIDPLYGGGKGLFLSEFKADYRLGKGKVEKPLIDRLTLHAYELRLPDSTPDRPETFIARLDNKFAAAIKMLTRHGTKGLAAFINPEHFSNILNAQSL